MVAVSLLSLSATENNEVQKAVFLYILREVILFLLHSCENPSGVLPSGIHKHRKDMGILEWIQRRSAKMIRGLEHLFCEEKMQELGLFSLEKRRVQGDHIVTFQCLKGACKNNGDKCYSKACCDTTRGNGFELKAGRFRLDIKREFLWGGWWNSGTGCPERWEMPHQWKHSRSGWWASEKPDITEDVPPAHFRVGGLGDL